MSMNRRTFALAAAAVALPLPARSEPLAPIHPVVGQASIRFGAPGTRGQRGLAAPIVSLRKLPDGSLSSDVFELESRTQAGAFQVTFREEYGDGLAGEMVWKVELPADVSTMYMVAPVGEDGRLKRAIIAVNKSAA